MAGDLRHTDGETVSECSILATLRTPAPATHPHHCTPVLHNGYMAGHLHNGTRLTLGHTGSGLWWEPLWLELNPGILKDWLAGPVYLFRKIYSYGNKISLVTEKRRYFVVVQLFLMCLNIFLF